MTSNHHGLYAQGYTRTTMVKTKRSYLATRCQSQKLYLSSDWSLQLDSMKLESLVMADQLCRREYVPGPCTQKGAWQFRKQGGENPSLSGIKQKSR